MHAASMNRLLLFISVGISLAQFYFCVVKSQISGRSFLLMGLSLYTLTEFQISFGIALGVSVMVFTFPASVIW